jgi:hypothetical protein
MKLIAALVLLANSVSQSTPAPSNMDAQEIVRAVLTREAYVYGSGREPVCVKAAVDGITLEGWRGDSSRRTRIPHSASSSDIPDMSWAQLSRFDGEYLRSGNRLSSLNARPINEAVGLVLRAPSIPHLVRRVDQSWLPRPFNFCRKPHQWRRLEIASPAITGDMAFVAADYFCPLCGEGAIFALQRRASGWTVIAEVWTWSS